TGSGTAAKNSSTSPVSAWVFCLYMAAPRAVCAKTVDEARRLFYCCATLQHQEVSTTAKIIDGKGFAEGLRPRVAGHVSRLKAEHGIIPGLAVVIVGHDPASQVYVTNKAKQTAEVGMASFKYELAEDVSEAELLELVRRLNSDEQVHGILVQLPLPAHIDSIKVIEAIAPSKDVDCFT